MPLALTKSAIVCASLSVKTVQSSFQPIMGVMPIMAWIWARVLPGKINWIWSAVALKETMEACASVGGEIIVLTLSAPKVMVMALIIWIFTPALTALLIRLRLLSLSPRNQAGRVKEV